MINARVSSIPDGSLGCDLTNPLNAASAKQYYNNGYRFIVRYIGRGDGSRNFVDLTQDEGQAIVDAGLALGVVQHPLAAGWSPTAKLGDSFGAAAANLAGAAGLPGGITIWLDLEGVAQGTQAEDVIGYCNAWFKQVSAVNFIPGVYIGANPAISEDQMYWDLLTKSYWRGGSDENAGVPATIPNRGYQMVQRISVSGGVEFDSNVVNTDNFGGKVFWCVSN
jgi:hypothetical protein